MVAGSDPGMGNGTEIPWDLCPGTRIPGLGTHAHRCSDLGVKIDLLLFGKDVKISQSQFSGLSFVEKSWFVSH